MVVKEADASAATPIISRAERRVDMVVKKL